MNLLREYIRALFAEQNVIATGMCFPFAYQKAEEWFEKYFTPGGRGRKPKKHPNLNDKSKFKVVHGTVTDKWKKPPKPVVHGWVEMGNLVFDDQTRMTKPNGVDKEVYYDMYQPEVYKEFTAEEAILNCAMKGGEGPWDDDLYAMMQDRDAWMNEAVVTGRKLDRHTTAIKRHVINAIKDPEVREHFRQTGAAQFKLQNVPEVAEIDYLRDVIIDMLEGQSVNADAAYEFDLDASPEQRATSDLRVNLVLPRDYPDQILSHINDELVDAIRHELEHSGQETWELMDCQEKTPTANVIWQSLKNAGEYYLCPAEIKAHIAGFMKRAKSAREPLGDIIDYELYRIYETGKAEGYSEEDLHDFMIEMRQQYYDYARKRYPQAQGL